jgi:hypothetical protein
MRARRLLFVRSRDSGLAPIYAALLLLVVLGLIGLIIASWPQRAHSASPPAQGDVAPASRPFDGGLRLPKEARQQSGRGTWM